MIEEGISYVLTHTAAITRLVGDRCYPVSAPASTSRPYVTWQFVSSQAEQDLDARGGLRQSRIQFDAWSDRYLDGKRVLEEIRLAFERANDTRRLGRVTIACVLSGNILDLPEPPQSGQSKPIHHSVFDAEFTYEEEPGRQT